MKKKKISLKQFMENLHVEINDLKIKIFHFNFIQVNTYILYDDTKEAVIIDPGNYIQKEDAPLQEFIEKEQLKVKYLINTHPHIDHIFGNDFGRKTFGAKLMFHEAGVTVYQHADEYCSSFVFQRPEFPMADHLLKTGETINFGNQQLEVLYTPGHCDGSICLLDKKNGIVFTGDVLFEESVGRTDLPTGNTDLLMKSIHENLLPLPDETIVFSGHGDRTSIGHERKNNPYIS